MVQFITITLGLVVGPQQVEVQVDPRVAAVELRLDGAAIARLTGPPWRTTCDLGRALRPHVLEAVALDRSGGWIGSARQTVNLPHPACATEIVLERDPAGRPVAAQVVSKSIEFETAERVELLLDGRPLKLDARYTTVLPALDGTHFHLLAATVHYPAHVRCSAEIALSAQDASSELTAVSVVATGEKTVPDRAALEGRFAARGQTLRVVDVEDGPASIIVVPDLSALRANPQLWRISDAQERAGRLEPGDELRFLVPVPRTSARGRGNALFDVSQPFQADRRGLPAWVARFWRHLRPGSQKLTEAVAVAGVRVTEQSRRRAVVLLIGEGAGDSGSFAAPDVREFLAALHVPLLVWRTGQELPAAQEGWGSSVQLRSMRDLETAIAALRADLRRQRIVWLEGTYAPHEISITDDPAAPLQFAGSLEAQRSGQ